MKLPKAVTGEHIAIEISIPLVPKDLLDNSMNAFRIQLLL